MEEKIFLARVAEQAERFDDMVQFLDEAIALKAGDDFTVDERNLFVKLFQPQTARNNNRIVQPINHK